MGQHSRRCFNCLFTVQLEQNCNLYYLQMLFTFFLWLWQSSLPFVLGDGKLKSGTGRTSKTISKFSKLEASAPKEVIWLANHHKPSIFPSSFHKPGWYTSWLSNSCNSTHAFMYVRSKVHSHAFLIKRSLLMISEIILARDTLEEYGQSQRIIVGLMC